MFANGGIVDQDLEQAKYFYRLAAANYPNAKESLKVEEAISKKVAKANKK